MLVVGGSVFRRLARGGGGARLYLRNMAIGLAFAGWEMIQDRSMAK